MMEASAPGKIILFGEHAVVYGRPAIAAPVTAVQATATVTPAAPGSGLLLELPDIGERVPVSGASTHVPLAMVAMLALQALGYDLTPDWTLTVRSTIPVASGLGSGAAAATAIVRVLAAAAGATLSPAQVSALVYQSEKLFHGTPSGVDNTVIAYGLPVWFVRGEPPQPFTIARPLTVVIGDTGIPSPTSVTVGDVRRGWQAEPARFEALFDAVGQVPGGAAGGRTGRQAERRRSRRQHDRSGVARGGFTGGQRAAARWRGARVSYADRLVVPQIAAVRSLIFNQWVPRQ